MYKKIRFHEVLLILIAVIILIPVFYMFYCTIVPGGQQVSLISYYEVLLSRPDYLIKFWKSVGLSAAIASGQTIVSCMAGTAFAKYSFTGKRLWFLAFMLFMILPIQVMLVPSYIIFDKLHMLNSWKALIIPGIFSPFGTVWMTHVFQALPSEWLEAASLDGVGKVRGVLLIMMPAARPAVLSVFIFSFVEAWNMVEQPVNFLKDFSQYPLSVFVASVVEESIGVQSVCGVLCLLPVTFLFLYYNNELMEGIGDDFWS
ncbi:MAG: carbohydrate ABC transporter permease [Dorea sp.]|jgi:multiple sugar transport system permease protein|nr:carbohydrate ABC transporter permease [Dorea sp.]MCI9614691.1 carbohydrate ABC transporter permease [Dorea sp.]